MCNACNFVGTMSVSTSELLDAVNTAILQCLAAQAYSIAGRNKQMAQLRDLRELRQQLLNEVACDGPMFQLAMTVPASYR